MKLLLKPLVAVIFLVIWSSSLDSYQGQQLEKDNGNKFRACKLPYECGHIKKLLFPFWGGNLPSYCGYPDFKVSCDPQNRSIFNIQDVKYILYSINSSNQNITVTAARLDLLEGPCSGNVDIVSGNLTYRYDVPFYFPQEVENVTLLYGCDNSEAERLLKNRFLCPTPVKGSTIVYYANDSVIESLRSSSGEELDSCESLRVSVYKDALNESLRSLGGSEEKILAIGEAWRKGFEVVYSELTYCKDCMDSGGICGYNDNSIEIFSCFCPRHYTQRASYCLHPGKRDWLLKGGIAVGAIFAGIILMGFVVFCYQRRNKKTNAPPYFLSRSISSNISSVKDIEKGSTYFGVHLFSYEELVEATNNFDSSKELGDGGFGTVYYGKLHDGREVAVKRLYESNCRRVEQFMNEVTILASLRHPNLVSLFGCTSRHSHGLLLVYEYIQNGTVADHLHGQRAKPGALAWPMRLKIAIETACALAYLHASDIVHRDVKTTNILLDSSFSVKVADFGLSRLFPTHVTHVSTAPQGTPGYVDPEYHQCYQLTSKSDVYSFGVVLMELVSSMPAVDIARHRHDINLSTMAINRIQNHTLHEIVDPCLKFDTDIRVKQTITGVAELAFQCLQNEKDLRPSMVDVLEELKAIQSRGYKTKNAKNDSTEDDVGLLKCGPLTLSPDTVTISWSSSRNTTPNASG
ncbi:LEAF RUST 10 DISEASE-RESISTANCE LOCUS RECEPTOR-LIKE PROTEIN KINASE-like 1.2 isoform X2 [Cannabis sativa]|uniref:LEAF RUST 10 DISEASE-RESISTANCE LOCUS RECEPTOR-LIKE PROTEIN KINASE-like 1.2 isoform X2 n=1 Tax=Cannabis sativa TaxID=3483 RepID=UPI0029CA3A31|nr:LEAF RUST 10 DISEASE-RESISTANCE LOCUS RECEPTOR-LIKE PROTEIN KINASE-like 1.2 isoform X2 [Cannabis sativa]